MILQDPDTSDRRLRGDDFKYQDAGLLQEPGVVVEVVFDETGDEVIAVIVAGLHANGAA